MSAAVLCITEELIFLCASSSDIADNDGNTFLHILASQSLIGLSQVHRRGFIKRFGLDLFHIDKAGLNWWQVAPQNAVEGNKYYNGQVERNSQEILGEWEKARPELVLQISSPRTELDSMTDAAERS
jgi:hypothetical protein